MSACDASWATHHVAGGGQGVPRSSPRHHGCRPPGGRARARARGAARTASARGPSSTSRVAAGRRTANSLPSPGPSLDALTVPPCSAVSIRTRDRAQPEPTLGAVRATWPLHEQVEEARQEDGVDAAPAVVANAEGTTSAPSQDARHLDAPAGGRVAGRVRQEIAHHLGQADLVSLDREAFGRNGQDGAGAAPARAAFRPSPPIPLATTPPSSSHFFERVTFPRSRREAASSRSSTSRHEVLGLADDHPALERRRDVAA